MTHARRFMHELNTWAGPDISIPPPSPSRRTPSVRARSPMSIDSGVVERWLERQGELQVEHMLLPVDVPVQTWDVGTDTSDLESWVDLQDTLEVERILLGLVGIRRSSGTNFHHGLLSGEGSPATASRFASFMH
jgi:hypothetical protein